jgi:RecJ-like exonuclease
MTATDSARILPDDEVLLSMEKDFEKAGSIIKSYLDRRSPLVIRYHGDCDGICSALSIYLSAKQAVGEKEWVEYRKKLLIFKNPSAIYSIPSVLDDMELVRHMQSSAQPLAILLDFSVNSESIETLKTLRKAKFDILIADHHPPEAEIKQIVTLLVSPWLHGGNSDYTAGLIAGEIARKLRPFDDIPEFEKISLTGDRSKLPVKQEEHIKHKALVLDFMSSSSDFAESLETYYLVLQDSKKIDSIYKMAMKKIDEARKQALNYSKLKELNNGFKVVLVRLEKVKSGDFPPKGRMCGEVHDEFSKKVDAPLVTIAYGDRAMHIRANAKAREAGFNANQLIGILKSDFKNGIESGGGHDVAAGIRINTGFQRMVLDELLKRIGEIGK